MEVFEPFRKAVAIAGLTGSMADIAQALGITESYARRLWDGRDHVSKPLRYKFDALIAAKGNGQVESAHVLEHGEIKERAALPGTKLPVGHVSRTGYLVDPNNETGEYRIIRIVANCPDYHTACKLCDLLNKDAG